VNTKDFNIENTLKGITQWKKGPNQFDYHVISISKKDNNYHSILEQPKFGSIAPPTLNSFKSMQHSFLCNIRQWSQTLLSTITVFLIKQFDGCEFVNTYTITNKESAHELSFQ